jgi:hypothetical protein
LPTDNIEGLGHFGWDLLLECYGFEKIYGCRPESPSAQKKFQSGEPRQVTLPFSSLSGILTRVRKLLWEVEEASEFGCSIGM